MAIQFPPVQAGDPEPQDGDTYLYLITQREFVCHRTSTTQTPQWSEIGTINTTSFGYRGGLNIVSAAPNDVNSGNIYSVLDGGTAHISFTGIAGDTIQQYTLIIYDGSEWTPIDISSGNLISGPWVRTVNGEIKPAVATDDLNMDQGDYRIDNLTEL